MSLTGFDTDGDTLTLGYRGAEPVTLTRRRRLRRRGIEAAVERLTGKDVTVAGGATTSPGSSRPELPGAVASPTTTGFKVIFAGDPDPTPRQRPEDMAALVVTAVGRRDRHVGETAQGGAAGNGGAEVTSDNHAPVVKAPANRTSRCRRRSR